MNYSFESITNNLKGLSVTQVTQTKIFIDEKNLLFNVIYF